MAAARKYSMNKLSPLGRILNRSFKSLGIDLKIAQQKVIDQWLEIVGEPIDSVSNPRYFKFRTLFVNVSDSMWLHQLVFMEDQIKEKINKFVGRKLVQKIYFKIGELSASKAKKPIEKEDSHIDLYGLTNKNDEKDADAALNVLKDADLKIALKKIMIKGKGAEMFRHERKEADSICS
tara:strand:+ start:11653 stop:12186 length:534 start_codon:yes stop_codon:yes gene_type:complete